MARIHPFSALLPPAELIRHMSCPPYDVVTTEQARQFLQNNPRSFMRIIRADAEWPSDSQPDDERVHARARENFGLFQRERWLQQQQAPHFFVYRLRDGDHVQTGVVACCAVEEYEAGAICRHENTKPDKENDRTQHMLALAAHPEPVLLAYRGDDVIEGLVQAVCHDQPLFDFVAEDGVQHQLWPVSASAGGNAARDPDLHEKGMAARLSKAFARIPRLYIADGHHRCAGAARVRAACRASNAAHTGEEEYNFFPAVLFPAPQLRILAYNRVLRRLAHWQPEAFLQRLQREFAVKENASGVPRHAGEVQLYFSGQWHGVTLHAESAADPAAQLDLSRLQSQLLEPFFGVADQRTDARIDFIGGQDSVAKLQQLVESGEAEIGLSLFPPSLAELFAVSDRGELMPPKSTWFEPKLRSGLFVHAF